MSDAPDRLAAALADRYRIERELGQGGMATVYLAEDLKHDRKVAIKVLKPELAAVLGADRFLAEIKTTASLQHPNILPLFDSGTADGFLYYVMPYVEGESLRDKLDRETQLGVDEAVRITREVADALDYAHRQGVVHRDVKPENILLHDGRPMVADFGIALAVSAAAGGRMTETGLSLGTPHYMSPEQATAEKDITGRSDVYSLASVLYEMLTGDPPHVGSSAQQIIMKIVTEEAAPVTKLRKSVPPNVAAAVAKGLEKLPADRFESAKAFADALADPAFRTAGREAAGAGVPGTSVEGAAGRPLAGVGRGARRHRRGRGVGAAPADLAAGRPRRLVPAATPGRGLQRAGVLRGALAGRPDVRLRGHRGERRAKPVAAWAGHPRCPEGPRHRRGGGAVLVTGREVRGVFRARCPDAGGRALGISADALSRDARGVGHLGDVRRHRLQHDPGPGACRRRGRPVRGRDPPGLHRDRLSPPVVPAGGHPGPVRESGGAPADGDGGRPRVGRHDGAHPGCGRAHLGAARDTWYTGASTRRAWAPVCTLSASVPMARRSRGTPRRSRDRCARPRLVFAYTASRAGSLLYLPGLGDRDKLVVDRSGDVLDTVRVGNTFTHRYAHDHPWVALANAGTVWLYDLTRGLATPLVPRNKQRNTIRAWPVWAPSDSAVAFGACQLFAVRIADLSIRPIATRSADCLTATDWSSDGRYLIVTGNPAWAVGSRREPATASQAHTFVAALDLARGRTVRFNVPGNASEGALSPDMRWLAYTSDETGTAEVYVQPFPGGGRPVRISREGGRTPRWSADGRELFFEAPDGGIMAASVTPGADFQVAAPRLLFHAPGWTRPLFFDSGIPYAVSPDGQRFIVRQTASATDAVLVQNWPAKLEAKGGS